ncbi:MAG: hypothetical protein ABIP61_10355 [Burkholderiaceae bacterium]
MKPHTAACTSLRESEAQHIEARVGVFWRDRETPTAHTGPTRHARIRAMNLSCDSFTCVATDHPRVDIDDVGSVTALRVIEALRGITGNAARADADARSVARHRECETWMTTPGT